MDLDPSHPPRHQAAFTAALLASGAPGRSEILGESGRTVVELVEAIRGGERTALNELVRALEGPLLRLATRITGDPVLAEDAFIDAIVKLCRQIPELESARAFPTYARRTICTVALDLVRTRNERDGRKALRDTARLNKGAPPSAPVLTERIEGSTQDAEAQLLAAERRASVQAELSRVGEPGQTILRMLYEQGRTYDQISEMLDIPRRTVLRRAGAARLLLAARLRGLEGEIDGA
jgi:RNA polymerase sigma factor (sigma-70 family)